MTEETIRESETRSRVQQFIKVIVNMALDDAQKGIPERHKTNGRGALMKRVGRFFTDARNGDSKYMRSVYTAAHWLYSIHSEVREAHEKL